MYQDFGARVEGDTGRVRFRLFVPDNALDPGQYRRGTLPGIDRVHAIGDYQGCLGANNWTVEPEFEMVKSQFTDPEDGNTKGRLVSIRSQLSAPIRGGLLHNDVCALRRVMIHEGHEDTPRLAPRQPSCPWCPSWTWSLEYLQSYRVCIELTMNAYFFPVHPTVG
jgi:hypothetical protein